MPPGVSWVLETRPRADAQPVESQIANRKSETIQVNHEWTPMNTNEERAFAMVRREDLTHLERKRIDNCSQRRRANPIRVHSCPFVVEPNSHLNSYENRK